MSKHFFAYPCTAIILALGALTIGTQLTGCGYQLRGSHSTATLPSTAHQTQIVLSDDETTTALKQPLTERLRLLGVHVNDQADNIIKIENVRVQRFELVGVLTEVRLVMSGDVSHTIHKNGQAITVLLPVQAERTYQYNKASVSSSDKQSTQAHQWLYQGLAERIVEQYYAHAKPD